MSENTERVTFRLTPSQSDAIDEIMMKFNYRTRSQVFRAAIENLINDTRDEWNSKKIVVHIPKFYVVRLDNAVEDGFALSREELINKALGEYLERIERYLNEWDTYQEKRITFKKAIENNPSITKS